MIKFVANGTEGSLYGFGLSEGNLNRLQFNQEPIFFSFEYAGVPELFGLVFYMSQFKEPIDIFNNPESVQEFCVPFLDDARGITVDALRVFPLAQSVMQKFRSTPFWGFEAKMQITHPGDRQMFFSGRTNEEIEEYFQGAGLLSPKTKRTYKGFGKRE